MQIQSNFQEVFKTYLENKSLDIKSINNYLMFYHKFVNIYPELNQSNVDSFLKNNTSSPARATIKNLIQALIRTGLPQENKNELLGIDLLKQTGKKDKHIAKFMQKSDIERLDLGISLFKPIESERLKLMILVQFYAGLRVSELVAITYNHLRKEEYEKNTDKKYQMILISSESAKFGKERIAYLPTEIYVRLLKWIKERIIYDQEYNVLFNKDLPIWNIKGKEIKIRRYTGLLNHWTKQILGESFNSHSLRHGRGTDLLLNEKVPIEIVKDFLGHSDIGTTQQYAHISNKDVKDALENI
jgi:integrase